MFIEIPHCDLIKQVLAEPTRQGGEWRWSVQLVDGRRGLLSQLLPELACDEATRRRYLRDALRTQEIAVKSVAEVLAVGPQGGSPTQELVPPWRLRIDPEGENLEDWLERRSPAPVDEAVELCARLAEALHEVHRHGVVLRNLRPRNVVLGQARLWLTDVGMARTDILSTRTAASLLLESSPYVAPEHLRSTTLDLRADLYSVGVILWRALTATLPFADEPAFLREPAATPPRVTALRTEVVAHVETWLLRCLESEAKKRPRSARELADGLRGHGSPSGGAPGTATCQACDQPLRVGLRLCLSCGKSAVQFHTVGPGERGFAVDLVKAQEQDDYLRRLRSSLEVIGEGKPPQLNFLVGDARWYSKEEQKSLIKVPARLVEGLDAQSAATIANRLQQSGMQVRTTNIARQEAKAKWGVRGMVLGAVAVITAIPVFVVGSIGGGLILVVAGGAAFVAGLATRVSARQPKGKTLVTARTAPAALPASDTLVKKLADALAKAASADVHSIVSELALLVQRLVDHRASFVGDAAELELVAKPVAPLVDIATRAVEKLAVLEAELEKLDEGALVRALAGSEARGEPDRHREPMLRALDRLRVVEDERQTHLSRLLEAASLLERAVELGLSQHDEHAAYERDVRLALAALGGADEG